MTVSGWISALTDVMNLSFISLMSASVASRFGISGIGMVFSVFPRPSFDRYAVSIFSFQISSEASRTTFFVFGNTESASSVFGHGSTGCRIANALGKIAGPVLPSLVCGSRTDSSNSDTPANRMTISSRFGSTIRL